jgi:hypothetical protein
MSTAILALLATTLLPAVDDDPAFETSDTNGGWSTEGYYVHNNMWNSSKYDPCTSTLRAWSPRKWEVVARMNDKKGDGAVKTYPNVHRDYGAMPIGSFEGLTSRFAEESPHVGVYNVAYDLWINGIATPGCTEIMIWTENFGQVPGGQYAQDVTFGDREYKAYRTKDGGYIALVAKSDFTSGTVDLLEILKWAAEKGWLPADSTVDQVCFGVELVSTDDAEATFRVTDFSIDAKLK